METYYIGDDIPLEFQVLVNGKPVQPTSVVGKVYNPASQLIYKGNSKVTSSKISFRIPGKSVVDCESKEGQYTAMFDVMLAKYGLKNHIMKFKLIPMPVKKKIRQAEEKDAAK